MFYYIISVETEKSNGINVFYINSETVVNWSSHYYQVCDFWLGEQQQIGGPGAIVEIDESKFGKSKYRITDEGGKWGVNGSSAPPKGVLKIYYSSQSTNEMLEH